MFKQSRWKPKIMISLQVPWVTELWVWVLFIWNFVLCPQAPSTSFLFFYFPIQCLSTVRCNEKLCNLRPTKLKDQRKNKVKQACWKRGVGLYGSLWREAMVLTSWFCAKYRFVRLVEKHHMQPSLWGHAGEWWRSTVLFTIVMTQVCRTS